MYKDYLYLKDSKNNIGKGVFTKIDIPKKIPIMNISGKLYTEDSIPDPNYVLQITNKWFIGLSGDVEDYVNHSCNPNCYMKVVGKRAILYSLYEIKAGTELTFDYSTTSTDNLDQWQMSCNCGYVNCRKIISGFQYLDDNLKKQYIEKDIIPQFIINPIFKHV